LLLAAGPNDWSSTFELIRDLVATALTHDKGGLALVNRIDGGRLAEVILYEPSHTVVDYCSQLKYIGYPAASCELQSTGRERKGPFGERVPEFAGGTVPRPNLKRLCPFRFLLPHRSLRYASFESNGGPQGIRTPILKLYSGVWRGHRDVRFRRSPFLPERST
jgi:hypothetical protein